MEQSYAPHRSTERVLEILEYLTDTENVGKKLTEIANALSVPKSSILPILRTLVTRGYLHYNPLSAQYFIGYKLYEIGTKYVNEESLDGAIYQIMLELASTNNITVTLGELVSGDVLFVKKVDPFEKLRIYTAIGRRMPAYSMALGKVLLSDKDPSEIKKLYPQGLTPVTPNTIKDFDTLFNDLISTRERGFALAYEEATRYVCSMAVPIRSNRSVIFGLEGSMSVLDYNEDRERQILMALSGAKSKIESFLKTQESSR